MTKLLILYTTLTGNSQYVAEYLNDTLNTETTDADLLNVNSLESLSALQNYSKIIFICSTWGEGELPPDGEEFIKKFENEKHDFSKLKLGYIGLGDKRYEAYCSAINKVDTFFQSNLQLKKSTEDFTIDGFPENDILMSILNWSNNFLKIN